MFAGAEWIVFLVLLLFFAIFLLLAYSGLFTRITVRAAQPPFTEITVAYKFRTGHYKHSGKLFTEVVKLAPEQNFLGIYYDDPNKVAEEKLRYLVGCVLAEDGQQCGNADAKDTLVANGYKIAIFPAIDRAVTTTFPFRTKLSMFQATIRVYPRVHSFVKENRLSAHPYIEYYEDDTIYFVAPLCKQQEFYVDEAGLPAPSS